MNSNNFNYFNNYIYKYSNSSKIENFILRYFIKIDVVSRDYFKKG